MTKFDDLVAALRKPFLSVFLDGRNEHGSHVLMMPGDSIGDLTECESALNDQDEGLAEQIISEAETLGYCVGDCVVTAWRHCKDPDYLPGGYWEYLSIDPVLTGAFHGTPDEQDAPS